MPDLIVDPFAADGYSVAELTAAINILPNQYGLLGQKNLFPDQGVRTRTIVVEERNGILNLLQTQPPGSPGTQNKMGKRTVRSFAIPHIPHDDTILPEEYQGIRAFGTGSQVDPLAAIVNDHLQNMKAKHDLTREYLRMGALKGIILDADGSTLYNLYTEFGITAKTVSFALGTATTKVRSKCLEVVRHIEDNLKGEVMTGVECLCDQDFFDALISHALVKEAFANHEAAIDRLGGDPRKGFEFGGIRFVEYRGTATDANGTARKFIAADQAHFYPIGTMNTFKTYNGPADFLETANTVGVPYYAKQEVRKFGRGLDLHTQSNPLPLCHRPAVLVKGTVA
ncbi:MAG: major capsid protein [Desulfobulbales bacterium]|nr:major capsid protein [Desulfobulbales bacterium]